MSVRISAFVVLISLGSAGLYADEWEAVSDRLYTILDDQKNVRPLPDQLQPKVLFDPENGAIMLRNRGLIRSKNLYEGDLSVRFLWKWTEGQEKGSYQDVLTVSLYTNGNLGEKWAHEITDGIVIELQAHASAIRVRRAKDGKTVETFGGRENMIMKRDTEYLVEATVKDDVLTIRFDGNVVLDVKIPADAKHGRVAIYNREPVAGIPKASAVRLLRVTGTPKK